MDKARSFASAGSGGKWLALGLLILVGLTNYIDRLSMAVLQVPIKLELNLSDTQMGALTGLSFSLVYTLAALPIARLADRYSPKLAIIVSLVVWNAMTILCGFAAGFVSLAVLRMGVAVGEAGCGPATQALLARHFPAHQRGMAIASWQMVFPLGAFVGVALSGWLSEAFGWRYAFIILGAAGLAVAPLVAALLHPGQAPARSSAASPASGSFADALRQVLRFRSLRLLLMGGFVAAMPLNAALNWNAPFYTRVFDRPLAELSFYIGLIAGIGGAAGMLGGGFVADLLGRRDRRWYFWLPAMLMLAVPPLALVQYLLAGSLAVSLWAGLFLFIALNGWMPPQAAITQTIVDPAHRALAAGCILVTGGLGGALGPFLAGALSDALTASGAASGGGLPLALVLVSLTAVVAALLFFAAGARLDDDVRRFGDADQGAASLSTAVTA